MKFPIYELSRAQFSGRIPAEHNRGAIRRSQTSTVTQVSETSAVAAIERTSRTGSTRLWLLPWLVPPL
jgi:hypothetical protein